MLRVPSHSDPSATAGANAKEVRERSDVEIEVISEQAAEL
jgi:stage V sporulation protein SpoVS